MIIVAKFDSTCPKCGKGIRAGDKVEWAKGRKAEHAKCPSAESAAKAPAPKETTPAVSDAPFVAYEKWQPCKRAHLPSAKGETRRYVKTPPEVRKGAESFAEAARPAHGVYTVVGQMARYESTEDNEDMGDMTGAGWHVSLYLRPATQGEADKVLAEVAAREAAKAKQAADKAAVEQKKADFTAAMSTAATQPGYARVELWRHHDFMRAAPRTEHWKDARGSYRVTYEVNGQVVYESHDYIYDWDQPFVVVGPQEVVGPAAEQERTPSA